MAVRKLELALAERDRRFGPRVGRLICDLAGGRLRCRTCLRRRTRRELLALCDMRTLYLRNVPDQVVADLEALAAEQSMSVSALAVRELAEAVQFRKNAALLEILPATPVAMQDLVDAVREARDR